MEAEEDVPQCGSVRALRSVAAYAPFVLWKRAAQEAPLTAPEVHPLTAAVLFADISGFTKLTEDLSRGAAAGEGGGRMETVSLWDNDIRAEGASALAAVLKETKITHLECAAALEFAFLSAAC